MKALILKSVAVTALAFAVTFGLGIWLSLPTPALLVMAVLVSAGLIATVVSEEREAVADQPSSDSVEVVVRNTPKGEWEFEVELDPMDPHGDGTLQEGDMLFELMKVLMRGGHSSGIGVAEWNPETQEWEFDIVESPESSLTDAEIESRIEEWKQ